MQRPKILVPAIADRASLALDEAGENAFTSGYGITVASTLKESVKYLLGLLNSTLLDHYLKSVSTTMRSGYFRYFTQYLAQFPIRTIDFSNPADKRRHDEMVAFVEWMLELHKKLPAACTDQEKTALQRQVADTDRRIDRLVYDLYGLTEDEVIIVEGTA